MKEIEILSRLCYYDKRNPDRDEEAEKPNKECFCDNCFYGRTKLAEHILKLNDLVLSIVTEHDITTGGTISVITQEEVVKIKNLLLS